MRTPLLCLFLVMLLIMAQLISTAPARKSLRVQLNPNYVRAMAAYKRLESTLPREELRAITTIGILNGAKQTEKQMEQYLIDVLKDLMLKTDMQDKAVVLPKITLIEQQLQRDQRALKILTSAMDLATQGKDVKTFKQEMQKTLQQVRENKQTEEDPPKVLTVEGTQTDDVGTRVANLRQNILQQVNAMKEMVENKIERTLEQLIDAADDDGLLVKASHKMLHKRDTSSSREVPAEIRMINSILTEADFRNNLIDDRKDELDSLEDNFDLDVDKEIANRSSNTTMANNTVTTNKTNNNSVKYSRNRNATTTPAPKSAKQEEGSPEIVVVEAEMPMGGGGLVGIISSLSGGEGGSDIGALIGALTGVISTLFGPGGLDIESLISTATSLIAGLLAGNKNFGTVLGMYVGTAFDGLSGGGGAVNNGQFIGNFLGTVVASLSADPEEDDQPPKPFLFVQNLFSSFLEAKNRKPDEDNEERRHDQKGGEPAAAGSDSGGFIKHIVAHLVGSAVSLILNASLGASGGASKGSSSLFTSSSGHSKPPAGHGVKSW